MAKKKTEISVEQSQEEMVEQEESINVEQSQDQEQEEIKPDAEGPTGVHKVVNEFRDINDFSKLYNPGDDVSHFDKNRLDKLVELRHVEIK